MSSLATFIAVFAKRGWTGTSGTQVDAATVASANATTCGCNHSTCSPRVSLSCSRSPSFSPADCRGSCGRLIHPSHRRRVLHRHWHLALHLNRSRRDVLLRVSVPIAGVDSPPCVKNPKVAGQFVPAQDFSVSLYSLDRRSKEIRLGSSPSPQRYRVSLSDIASGFHGMDQKIRRRLS